MRRQPPAAAWRGALGLLSLGAATGWPLLLPILLRGALGWLLGGPTAAMAVLGCNYLIGDGINDAIALRRADASVSLRGATTMATDAAQVVLMEDDLAQLDALWDLSAGFVRSLDANERTAKAFSLSSACWRCRWR